ncbi:MAG: acyl-CoA thioesterase [Candidatus Poseidonia sp.]|nr:acyl-CoA thioesterase [Poseidonia sp.]
MAVEIQRAVEFSMIDMANVAYYPRIFDLAHKVFEEAWLPMCGVSYPTLINERRVGFPVVSLTSTFHAPLRYGDTITASVGITSIGTTSLGWKYEFRNPSGETLWVSEQATVCVNMDTMEKQPIPDDLRTGLTQHLED